MYRSELERLMTLASDDVDAACRGERLPSLMTRCVDEYLELSELADESATACDVDAHAYYAQEAAAWRATARVLRSLSTDTSLARDAQGAA
ncbi:hypothetical protein [Gordonia sp. MP11Mi]|uniref:TY-Chap C-terminal domain-containing protein n=1 Tax=Gordonia sp. MP11Mi TaxID=3022769 RepID=A0AA97CSQ9_9ACTN